MTTKEKEQVYHATGARVYFDRGRRMWTALWLGNGCEHRVMFSKRAPVAEVVKAITEYKVNYTAIS
jgi:hypothetical protein